MTITEVNSDMIVLGREFRGLTQKELAIQASISQANLSKMELGRIEVSKDALSRISHALELPLNFFTQRNNLFPPNLYYRKRASTSQKSQKKANAEMNIHRLSIQTLLQSIELDSNVPQLDIEAYGHPEKIAKHLRQYWSIPKGPIRNIVSTLESKGVFIVYCNFDSGQIDGRSMCTDDRHPIIYVNRNYPFDRQKFTIAHELGHLIMHMKSVPEEGRDIEKEANIFASEFLVPGEEIRLQLKGNLTVAVLSDLKKYWGVSMAMLLNKAKAINAITPTKYKNMWVTFSKMGFRTSEPPELEPKREFPLLLKRLIELHKEDLEYSEQELADILHLHPSEIKEKYDLKEERKLRLIL